jgi:hypothetical protein
MPAEPPPPSPDRQQAVRRGSPLETALARAAEGRKVVPLYTPTDGVCDCRKRSDCPSPGKHPRTAHGLTDASSDPEQIRKWFRMWPDANRVESSRSSSSPPACSSSTSERL